MAAIPVSSSMIASVGYDPETSVLEVTFSNGRTYEYEGVPSHVFDGMIHASSVGRFFIDNVRDIYNTR